MARSTPKPRVPIPANVTVAAYPMLAAQLDPAEGPADQIQARSRRPLWWICDQGPDHRWLADPYRRISQSSGCPSCSGRQASVTNNLERFPGIAAELDLDAPETGGLTAAQIVAGSHRKVGWKCRTCGHRWPAQVGPRTERGVGCPACTGAAATPTSNLATAFPHIAAQWHPTKNGTLRPQNVRPGSVKKVWWLCRVHPDHEWDASPNARTNPATRTRCPACSGYQLSATNSIAALFPELAAEVDPARNGGRDATQILAGTEEKIVWSCQEAPDHVWPAAVYSRTAGGNGCPACSGRQVSVTNMLARHPKPCALFDYAANAPETPWTLSESSTRVMWWRCRAGPDHVWQAKVRTLALAGEYCGFCSGNRVSVTNSLATLCPEVAAQLHPELNGGLTAEAVTAHSGRTVTWSCPQEHTWSSTVTDRVSAIKDGHGACPRCRPYGRSQQELAIASALAHALPRLTVDPYPASLAAGGRLRRVDITVAELNLIIEFDGAYHHRNRYAQDVTKAEALRNAGWTVVRLREAPLVALHPHDLVVPVCTPSAADKVADLLVAHLPTLLPCTQLQMLKATLARPAPTGGWRWQAPPDRFVQGLCALAAYAARVGHARPPSEHVEDGFALGRWVMSQRRLWRAGVLPDAQAVQLEALPGWTFDWRQGRWAEFITALHAFAGREGHLRVPQTQVEAGYRLGAKVAASRMAYRRGTMGATRVRELEALSGWAWESGSPLSG